MFRAPFDVFVSHASADRDVARAIHDRLEEAGIRAWLAVERIEGGTIWPAELPSAVDRARMLIAVYSSRATASPWVLAEITAAFDANKPLLPVRIEDVPLPDSLRHSLGLYQFIDAFKPPLSERLDEVVVATRRMLAGGARGAATAGAQPWGEGAAAGTLVSRKDSALRPLLVGDPAGAVAALREYLDLTPGDPVVRLALGVALARGTRLDQITYQCAGEMHRHFMAALSTPVTRASAALALLALQLDYYRNNGVPAPPPARPVLADAVREGPLSAPLLQVVQQLPMSDGTRVSLGL